MSDIGKTTSVNMNSLAAPKPQPNWIPSQKVLAGGLAGLVSWGITWAIQHWTGVTIDPQLQTAIVGAITVGITYLVPPAAQDVVRSLNNEIVAMAQADAKSPVSTPVVTQAQAVPVVVGQQVPADGKGVSK